MAAKVTGETSHLSRIRRDVVRKHRTGTVHLILTQITIELDDGIAVLENAYPVFGLEIDQTNHSIMGSYAS